MRRLGAAALLALAGCAGEPPAAPSAGASPDLRGTRWTLRTLGDGAEAPAGALWFSEGRVNGAGPCNTFFGGFEQRGAAVAIGPVASTRRACPEMDDEARFFAALTDAERFAIEDGRLVLVAPGGARLMVLDPAG